jgi:predicted Ser/Thr protein kinase
MIGRTIAHYRILEPLGEGGMGVVYLAEDLRLGRRVALKALSPRLAADPRERERLAHEARAVARLSHPSIAAVYSLEEDAGDLFIVSEYVQGETLRALMQRGDIPPARLAAIAYDTASALAAAHAETVVHRYLKPENIVVSESGAVKLLDFGLARILQDSGATRLRLTATGTVVGTVAYMSPEQLLDRGIDHRSDIFSFGVLLHEALGGRHPFEKPTPASTIAQICSADPPPTLRPEDRIARALAAVASRCLQKDPDARYQQTADLVADLDEARAGRSVRAAVLPAARGIERFGPRWWWEAHQIQVGFVYWLSLIPLWTVRRIVEGEWGLGVFFSGLAAAVVGSTLRWHLAFTSRVHPSSLAGEMKRSSRWIGAVDVVVAATMLVGAALIAREHNWWAALLVGLAVGVMVAARVIEPSTAKAAFRRSRSGRRPSRADGDPS